ncbi:YcjX family GTP-binding protein [Jannaschia ovalis]|uniref:YcjX family protein n=1 Tax=Jannaschia ovalis TaxID=3038773 RepID=A0ABY8LDN8_9RHOB|nr:YcjX family protein [Jannaschia sp. GRR-S6-38]WGH79435.1 YcjX family protein [Jannaschia sp. GRR-S6-38]
MIGRFTDAVTRGVGDVAASVTDVFDPTIRLGVTGLSRAGKTVFITSLVANLIDRGRMPGFSAGARIETAFLQPQPDDTVPRFDYEAHLADLTARQPHWPDGTRAVSELRLSLKVRPAGMLAGLRGARTVHLDIVDYPGEWLLDLGLMEKEFDDWSARALRRLKDWGATGYAAALAAVDPAAKLDEPTAQALARAYTADLRDLRAAGAYDLTPGRFLLPGELEGSPALTFAPMPPGEGPRGSLRREMARRFEAYKRQVVQPFFRDHFARLDRQIVLLDVLGAIRRGPRAVEEMRAAMADLLTAFKPGALGWLMALLGARRVDRVLFAATKADHLHHEQHARLTAILEAMVRDARARADFAGAQTRAMAIAALRATVEETREHGGGSLGVVRGRLLDTGREAALYPGALPDDPAHLLGPAREGAEAWLDADYDVMEFAPAPLTLRPGEGPPHIRLDRAADFLLADRL